MNNFMRREFLKKLLFASLLTSGTSTRSYALPKPDNKDHASSAELDIKMREAYKNWTLKFGQKPEDYLNSYTRKSAADKPLSYLSKEEFKAGKTTSLNEVLLGKTESAIILKAYFS